jgi:tRNA modification GTPase
VISQTTTTPDLDDTIVALSSPPGLGSRAIIRLSGREAARIARTLVPEFEPDPIAKRQVAAGGIVLPDVASPLPVDLFYFRAPATYTGQDLVELHTISALPLVELTIAELLRAGARGARPGEFTMRGFLAGKLDLTRAEAVHAVIEASGPDQLRRALVQLAGGLARPLDGVRDDLFNLLADVEAGLDFSEEDLSFVDQPQLLARLTKALAHVTLVGKQIHDRGAADPTFRVVLAGAPNAGKSSLFNALLGRDAALVSAVAGTTRDYLEADLVVEEMTIRLIDTAGLAAPATTIDAAAQTLGRDRLADADLILWCNPVGRVSDPSVNDSPSLERRLDVTTKADQDSKANDDHAVSALTGFHIDKLKALLAEKARRHAASPLAPSLSRCRHHVAACLDHLRRAHRIALEQKPAELLALELRLALDELGAIVGAVYTDDLLDRIFSRFCIGK